MPRRNRVDPWGDLHAATGRGLFTGNRGCLVDDRERVVRHHRGQLWITCVTCYRGWRSPLAAPRRWTPIFFLDDAVALAAGHRPCGLCRRDDYLAYRDAVTRHAGRSVLLRAGELNARLAAERLRAGRGLERAGDRQPWRGQIDELTAGCVIIDEDRRPLLVLDDVLRAFGFDGWGPPMTRPRRRQVDVLTPLTSVGALRHGFAPVLHPSAARDA